MMTRTVLQLKEQYAGVNRPALIAEAGQGPRGGTLNSSPSTFPTPIRGRRTLALPTSRTPKPGPLRSAQ